MRRAALDGPEDAASGARDRCPTGPGSKPRPAIRPAGESYLGSVPADVVGAGGFEPPNGRSKVSWLTTCRRPNGARGANLRMRDPTPPGLPLADAPTTPYSVVPISVGCCF